MIRIVDAHPSGAAPRLPRAAAILIVLMPLLLAACSTQAEPAGDPLLVRDAPPAVRTITTRSVPGLGTVLTDGSGHTLYMFPPDARTRVRCTGPCAGTWPTLDLAEDGTVTAGGAARQPLLATLPDPTSGARVVTYAGNPLYHYAGDVQPHQLNGQGLYVDGGPWYVLNPAGQPITATPTTPSASPTR